MRNGNNRMNWILLALCLISLAGHLLILERLPEQIPVHWNAAGEIDGYGPKSMDLIMGVIPLGIWVLMTALPRLDPRRKNYEKHQKAYGILTLLLILAMIAFSWMTALAGLGYNVDVGMLIPMVLGVVFVVMGNYMPKIRSNYFVGVRTPWAIENTWVWRKTQWMGGISFIVMGVVIFGSVFLPASFRTPVLLVVLLGGVAWDYLYSWLMFRKAKKEGKLGRYEEESED